LGHIHLAILSTYLILYKAFVDLLCFGNIPILIGRCFRLRGTGGKAETRDETSDDCSTLSTRPTSSEDQNSPKQINLGFPTPLKMEISPIVTFVVQSLHQATCADIKEAQQFRFKFDEAGWAEDN
jgi:hypothetical protein